MPAALLALVFWSAVLAAVVSQVMILRSTQRALRAAPPRSPMLEWTYAVVPAAILVLVLALSWRAAMRPPAVEVDLSAPLLDRRT